MPPAKKSKKPKASGNCYEAAGKYVLEACLSNSKCGLLLVHGEVHSQGPLEGMTFGHAWVLEGGTVIDVSNGRDIRMPKAVYYALGGIDRIGNTHTYTWDQAKVNILKYKHWGPWDLETKSGL